MLRNWKCIRRNNVANHWICKSIINTQLMHIYVYIYTKWNRCIVYRVQKFAMWCACLPCDTIDIFYNSFYMHALILSQGKGWGGNNPYTISKSLNSQSKFIENRHRTPRSNTYNYDSNTLPRQTKPWISASISHHNIYLSFCIIVFQHILIDYLM